MIRARVVSTEREMHGAVDRPPRVCRQFAERVVLHVLPTATDGLYTFHGKAPAKRRI